MFSFVKVLHPFPTGVEQEHLTVFGPDRTVCDRSPMTVRGGVVPRNPWLSCRCAEWARRLGAFAADAQDCIMVRVVAAHRIQGCGTNVRARQASSPRPRHPDHTKRAVVLGAVKVWTGQGGASERSARRPILTAPARASVSKERVGTKNRP